MNAPNNSPIFCRNGHRQQTADSKFCIFCGAPINVQPPPQFNQPPPPQKPSSHQSSQQPHQNFNAPPNQVPPQQNGQFNQPPPNQIPPPQFNAAPPQFNQPQFPPNQGQFVPPQFGQNNFYPNQNYPNQPPNNYYPQPTPYIGYQQGQVVQCNTCGVNGERLAKEEIICDECGWLRPLTEGYGVDCSAFQWAEDGKAMNVLRSLKPLTATAKTISDKVGRRWIETTFNGVLLSETQLPHIYSQAVRAARILGMSHMPDVYVSGEVSWDCRTYGSDKDSFIIMGTSLAASYKGDELLFLFAREMGHCRAGHALWKTVIRFLVGEQGPRSGLMSGGLLAALDWTKLVEGALEMPLLAWARQAEITADRAGLLAVGSEDIARSVLLSWSLKSPFLYRQINIESWLRQQAESDDEMTKLSELTTSSTPYITRRLKIMTEFAATPDLARWREIIQRYAGKAEKDATKQAKTGQWKLDQLKLNPPPKLAQSKPKENVIRLKCAHCGVPMRLPAKVLEGKEQATIRCPDAKCGKVTTLKKKINPASQKQDVSAKMQEQLEMEMNDDDN